MMQSLGVKAEESEVQGLPQLYSEQEIILEVILGYMRHFQRAQQAAADKATAVLSHCSGGQSLESSVASRR